MIFAILLVILVGLFFIATNSNNKICWAISLCIFGVCIMLFTGVLYISKFSYYAPQMRLDYYLYIMLSNLKTTMTFLAWLSNIGMTLVLISNMLFAYFLTFHKSNIKYLLILPIIFFFVTNSPPFNYEGYFLIHQATSSLKTQFLSNVFKIVENTNISIFLIYMCIPILTLVIYGKKTKIFFLKRDAWISIICMAFIDIFVLYTFVFNMFRDIMFHNVELLKFQTNMNLLSYSFFTPALLLFLISILIFFMTFYKPFRSLSVISEKQLIRNDKQLSKNLRMILHTEKNMFFTIGLLAKQGIENNENSVAKLQAIAELATQSTDNLSRTLELFRDSQMTFEKSDLVKCINDAIGKISNRSNNVSIKTYYENNENLYINMDENHIREVFFNLFQNSTEALKTNSENPIILINVTSEDGFAIIDITDNGCGIEKKNLRKIFSPLFSTKSNSTNWGVGLHYVNKVLQLHNGRIRVSSTPGESTTFQVVIPLATESERRFIWKKSK